MDQETIEKLSVRSPADTITYVTQEEFDAIKLAGLLSGTYADYPDGTNGGISIVFDGGERLFSVPEAVSIMETIPGATPPSSVYYGMVIGILPSFDPACTWNYLELSSLAITEPSFQYVVNRSPIYRLVLIQHYVVRV